MIRDFKDNLILLFFKESNGNYILFDLLRLLSMSQDFLEDRIDKLINDELLFVDDKFSYKITENGIRALFEAKFHKINLFELITKVAKEIKDDDIKTVTNNIRNNIYIPKNFENVVYSKKELDGLF